MRGNPPTDIGEPDALTPLVAEFRPSEDSDLNRELGEICELRWGTDVATNLQAVRQIGVFREGVGYERE